MSAVTGDWSVTLDDLFAKIPEQVVGKLYPPTPVEAPLQALRYGLARRQNILDSTRQRPLIRLWDKNMEFVAVIAQELSCECEWLAEDSGAATVVLRGDTWLADFITRDRRAIEDLHLTIDPNGNKTNWRTRWGGKITATSVKKTADGFHRVELQAVDNREHLKHLVLDACPFMPPEGPQKMWIFPSTARTAVATTLLICLLKEFNSLWHLPVNVFNPGAWLQAVTDTASISPLSAPLQVCFVDPLFDQSRATVVGARFSDAHTAFKDVLKDSGCVIRAYTYLAGEDEDTPHLELGPLNALVKPFMPNCICFSVEDKSGTTGPTGTFIDGYAKLITQTIDGVATALVDIDANEDGEPDQLVSEAMMLAAAPPVCVFRESEHSSIVESERVMHGSTARTVSVGGASPKIVNDLQNWAIRYGLSQLGQVIYSPVSGGYEQPGAEGIDNIWQNYLDNTFFAYMRNTDVRRALLQGRFGFRERFERGSGTAYTLSAVVDARSGLFKSRDFESYRTTVRTGPLIPFYDFDLADRVGQQLGTIIHADQALGIKFNYDKDTATTWGVSLGDTSTEEDGFARSMRTAAAIWGFVSTTVGMEGVL